MSFLRAARDGLVFGFRYTPVLVAGNRDGQGIAAPVYEQNRVPGKNGVKDAFPFGQAFEMPDVHDSRGHPFQQRRRRRRRRSRLMLQQGRDDGVLHGGSVGHSVQVDQRRVQPSDCRPRDLQRANAQIAAVAHRLANLLNVVAQVSGQHGTPPFRPVRLTNRGNSIHFMAGV